MQNNIKMNKKAQEETVGLKLPEGKNINFRTNKKAQEETVGLNLPEGKNINFRTNKKAQEETVGFVLIILIVIIVTIVFLSFSINPQNNRDSSSETSKFLGSLIYYTTDCAINWVPQYRDVQQLIIDCYRNENQKCLNGEDVCTSLETNIDAVIKESLEVDDKKPSKAYKFIVYYNPDPYETDNKNNEEKIKFEGGIFKNCTSKVGGIYRIPLDASSGKILVTLDICRG